MRQRASRRARALRRKSRRGDDGAGLGRRPDTRRDHAERAAIEFDTTHDSFLGDGDAELSFQTNKENLQQWISQSDLQWKRGVYKKDGQTLNEFTDNGTLIFKYGAGIECVVIDRTPTNLKQSPSGTSDSTTIFVNQTEGWVLIKDYDL
jgi:hypothetical protein